MQELVELEQQVKDLQVVQHQLVEMEQEEEEQEQ